VHRGAHAARDASKPQLAGKQPRTRKLLLLTFDEAAGAAAVVLPRRVVTIFKRRYVSKHNLETAEQWNSYTEVLHRMDQLRRCVNKRCEQT